MALKSRIYTIVVCLIFVALVIGAVGIYAMRNIYRAMEVETSISHRVSVLKDVRSEMQNVLISVREMVISSDAQQMQSEKNSIDKLAAEIIDPQLNGLRVQQSNQAELQRLKDLWEKHKGIVQRIYENTYANTSSYASRLAMGDGYNYWVQFEAPLQKIYDAGMAAKSEKGNELAMTAIQTLEALKSLQLQEKMMIVEDTPARVEKISELGKSEVNRYAALLNKIERLLTNPEVSDNELKSFSDQILSGIRGKFTNLGNGTVRYEKGVFTLPEKFINPEFADASRLY